MKPAKLAGK
jgi:hypothetical protein